MSAVTWVLESDVFPHTHAGLRAAVRDSGHRLVEWADTWWTDGVPAELGRTPTLFHGSLGNAARVHEELGWSPGSFCDPTTFCCSAWYESARDWLLHADWRMLPANEFDGATRSAVADQPRSEAWEFAQAVAESIASPAEVYVLDVCECDRELRLLELNPFGGADLYACNATEIVRAITEIL